MFPKLRYNICIPNEVTISLLLVCDIIPSNLQSNSSYLQLNSIDVSSFSILFTAKSSVLTGSVLAPKFPLTGISSNTSKNS